MSSSRRILILVVLTSVLAGVGCSSGKAGPPGPPPGPVRTTSTSTPAATQSTTGGNPLANTDPCALLTAAELATVMHGTPKSSATAPHTDNGLTQATCDWNTDAEKVSVYVVYGLPADQLALSFGASSDDAHGHTVDGVGDRAWVFSDIPADAQVDALTGGIGFTVDLLATNASTMQDKVIALAKAIAGRL